MPSIDALSARKRQYQVSGFTQPEVFSSGKGHYYQGITPVPLTTGGSLSVASSYATASVLLGVNQLGLVWVWNTSATQNTPTLSGGGVTWVQVATIAVATSLGRTTLFRAMGGSPSAGVLTIDFGGVNQTSCIWSVVAFDGTDKTGTNGSGAIRQSAVATALAATTLSISLAASYAPSLMPGSISVGGIGLGISAGAGGNDAVTPGSGYFALNETDLSGAGVADSIESEWNPVGSTTVNWSVGTLFTEAAGIAVEIVVPQIPPFGTVTDYDWPNPRGYLYPLILRGYSQQLLSNTLIPVVSNPFLPLDYPNPRGPLFPVILRGDSQNRITTTLLSQDIINGAPGQVPDYDYPNPRGLPYPLTLRGDTQSRVTTTLLSQDSFYGAPGQVPTQVLPVPKGPPFPISLRGFEQSRITTVLLSRDQVYGEDGQVPPYEWPVPKGLPRALSLLLNEQGQRVTTVLLSQDKIYADPGEVPPYEWPVPKGLPYPLILRGDTQNKVNTTLAGQDTIYDAPGEVPPYEWPVPKGLPYPLILRQYDQSKLLTTLVAQDIIYGAIGQSVPNYDWPVPKGPPYPLSLRGYDQSKILTTLLSQDVIYGTFGQVPWYEWLVPKGPVYPLSLRGFEQSKITTTLLGQDTIYGAAGQVPLYEWPVPKGKPYPQSLRTTEQYQRITTVLLGHDQIYGGDGQVPNYEWIVPKGFPYPLSLRTLINLPQLLADSLYNGKVPVYDWPNPRGPIFPSFLRQFEQTKATTVLYGRDIIYGADGEAPVYSWPVPMAPVRRIRQDFSQNQSIVFTVAQAPFTTWELAVPKGQPYPVGLRTFLQFLLSTTLSGPQPIYGAAGEVPVYQWPNPLIRRYVPPPFPVQTSLANVVTFVPIRPLDWPNPKLPPLPSILRTILYGFPPTVPFAPPPFFLRGILLADQSILLVLYGSARTTAELLADQYSPRTFQGTVGNQHERIN